MKTTPWIATLVATSISAAVWLSDNRASIHKDGTSTTKAESVGDTAGLPFPIADGVAGAVDDDRLHRQAIVKTDQPGDELLRTQEEQDASDRLLRFLVVDLEGDPIPKANIDARLRSGDAVSLRVRTCWDGRAVIELPQRSELLFVNVSASGFAGAAWNAAAEEWNSPDKTGEYNKTFSLLAAADLEVRAVDSTGRPLPGHRIEIKLDRSVGHDGPLKGLVRKATGTTNAAGVAHFEDVYLGEWFARSPQWKAYDASDAVSITARKGITRQGVIIAKELELDNYASGSVSLPGDAVSADGLVENYFLECRRRGGTGVQIYDDGTFFVVLRVGNEPGARIRARVRESAANGLVSSWFWISLGEHGSKHSPSYAPLDKDEPNSEHELYRMVSNNRRQGAN